MDNKSKQTLAKAINYKNYNGSSNKKESSEKLTQKKPDNRMMQEIKEVKRPIVSQSYESNEVLSTERLQEAIIWSEILGKPVSKRRKRR